MHNNIYAMRGNLLNIIMQKNICDGFNQIMLAQFGLVANWSKGSHLSKLASPLTHSFNWVDSLDIGIRDAVRG